MLIASPQNLVIIKLRLMKCNEVFYDYSEALLDERKITSNFHTKSTVYVAYVNNVSFTYESVKQVTY